MNTLKDKKYQNTSHFFFHKRRWRDMHIVHVFVWNLMIGHVFFSTNLTLIYLEISCTHIIAIAENHSKEITDNWKKKYKYTCIKTQITNNQVHKKLTTSMKQLRKILIKNFLSIVQITHNIKMPFPFKNSWVSWLFKLTGCPCMESLLQQERHRCHNLMSVFVILYTHNLIPSDDT